MNRPDKIEEFRCPFCTVGIPFDYMHNKTKIVSFKKKKILVCIGCAGTYLKMVQIATDSARALKTAKATGFDITPEQILAQWKESEEIRAEDEKLVDEEVDVFDGEKLKKIYKSNDPKKIMREKVDEGIRKEREGKIHIPVTVGITKKE